MTFEEFQASRREVDDVTAAVPSYHTEQPTAGYVYAGDLVIEKTSDGLVYLLIENAERYEEPENIGALEADLYEYATRAGFLDA